MGPLVTLGMVGGGTPDEVGEFEELIRLTRALVSRPFALWVVHHENKAGDVSGAWERVPDCLCHVQAQGNGHTRLHWRKARWADESHGTSLDLIWADGRSFTVRVPDSRDLHREVRELYAAGDRWRTAKEVAHELEAAEGGVRSVLRALVQLEELVFAVGPPGRKHNARCYRLAGELSLPAQQQLTSSAGFTGAADTAAEPAELPLVGKGQPARQQQQQAPARSGEPVGSARQDDDDTSEPAF
jgi:hypothetical protein